MNNKYRSEYCGGLNKKYLGKKVRLAGWIHRKRDHGGLIFVDLRDHTGICQLVFNPEKNKGPYGIVNGLRVESVISVDGDVVERSPETVNPRLATGEIEVSVTGIEVESSAEVLPFQIADEENVGEELRLKFRFLDLRREALHKNIIYRSKIINFIRQHLSSREFTEISTPILTCSSPEGARDYLVPSRIHKGKFYALPQAPQQFKQLLMISGFHRYFQIAPCFRDEDSRADRSPGEFYQLDLEMSFCTQEDVFSVVENLFIEMTEQLSDKQIMFKPFPRFSYEEAMNKFGTDKPDIRFGLEMKDVTQVFRNSEFKAFQNNTSKGKTVKALVVPGLADSPRSFFDKSEAYAKELGAGGLAYITMKDGKLKSPILKFFGEEEKNQLLSTLELKDGDAVFFGAGKWDKTCNIMGLMRTYFAKAVNCIPQNVMAFCWVVDFPMYEYNEDLKKIEFSHNPFSMPQGGMDDLLNKDPLDIKAFQYDIVCNGVELSSGAIRNHKPEIMYKAFEIAGYKRDEVDRNFGHMIKAFKYGAPPHGGIAPGIDRIVMLFSDSPNIREVIAFPMNQKAQDLMVGAPSEVKKEQLKELGIRIEDKEE
ncbi:MAG: aspartate--tRNA ligase [Candidatus Aureabacteria bacterium]|nr:aspartate--tRNA ligase [Candidatus Auribacterota bacterium]